MLGSNHEEPEAAEPVEGLMSQVGAHLRQARLDRGKDIEDVAEILRIQPGYLAGIERGDLSIIPGRTYALGFLRSYAEYLGFDGDDVIAQTRSSVGGLGDGAALQGRVPLTESRLPKVPILVLSLAVLAGAYAGWMYFQDKRAVPELVEEVPEELRERTRSTFDAASQAAALEAGGATDTAAPQMPVPHTGAQAALVREMAPAIVAAAERQRETDGDRVAAPEPTPLAEATPPAEPAPPPEIANQPEVINGAEEAVPALAPALSTAPSLRPAERGAVAPERAIPARGAAASGVPREERAGSQVGRDVSVVLPEASASPDGQTDGRNAWSVPAAAALETEPARAPRTYGSRSAGSRVVLRAREKAWVHVSSTSNDYLWVQTLRPGDRFRVPDRPGLVLWTGNAGGVEVLVDGTLLPPLGPDAEVVRDVSLQPPDLLRRLAGAPAEEAAESDLASTTNPPMMWRSSR